MPHSDTSFAALTFRDLMPIHVPASPSNDPDHVVQAIVEFNELVQRYGACSDDKRICVSLLEQSGQGFERLFLRHEYWREAVKCTSCEV